MMSDAFFDAVQRIEGYAENYPHLYGPGTPHAEEIETVRRQMLRLAYRLAALQPPPPLESLQRN